VLYIYQESGGFGRACNYCKFWKLKDFVPIVILVFFFFFFAFFLWLMYSFRYNMQICLFRFLCACMLNSFNFSYDGFCLFADEENAN